MNEYKEVTSPYSCGSRRFNRFTCDEMCEPLTVWRTRRDPRLTMYGFHVNHLADDWSNDLDEIRRSTEVVSWKREVVRWLLEGILIGTFCSFVCFLVFSLFLPHTEESNKINPNFRQINQFTISLFLSSILNVSLERYDIDSFEFS